MCIHVGADIYQTEICREGKAVAVRVASEKRFVKLIDSLIIGELLCDVFSLALLSIGIICLPNSM